MEHVISSRTDHLQVYTVIPNLHNWVLTNSCIDPALLLVLSSFPRILLQAAYLPKPLPGPPTPPTGWLSPSSNQVPTQQLHEWSCSSNEIWERSLHLRAIRVEFVQGLPWEEVNSPRRPRWLRWASACSEPMQNKETWPQREAWAVKRRADGGELVEGTAEAPRLGRKIVGKWR